MKGIPVWAIQGDDDVPVPRVLHAQTVEAFRKVGGEVKFPAMPGVGHDVFREVYAKPDLYDWFLQHTNPGLKPLPQEVDGVEVVTMEPLLVACATSQTFDKWKSIEQFARDHGLMVKPGTRFFALHSRLGVQAVTVGPDVQGNDQFKIMEIFGGPYTMQSTPLRYDAGPGPMGIYRDEARAHRWRSLHGFKFPSSGTIYEFGGSPLKQIRMYVPLVETGDENDTEKQQ